MVLLNHTQENSFNKQVFTHLQIILANSIFADLLGTRRCLIERRR